MSDFHPESKRPDEDRVCLWSLQLQLLELAEEKFGPRDSSYQICQPVFNSGNPYIIVAENRDAYASLSLASAGYWPTAIFELAHETVHLLNSSAGQGNYLEEGYAVAFSLEMGKTIGGENQPIGPRHYQEALQLVQALHGGVYQSGRLIRER